MVRYPVTCTVISHVASPYESVVLPSETAHSHPKDVNTSDIQFADPKSKDANIGNFQFTDPNLMTSSKQAYQHQAARQTPAPTSIGDGALTLR